MQHNLLAYFSLLHQKHADKLAILFFFFGFIFDSFTLGRIDDLSNILVLGLYLIILLTLTHLKPLWGDRKNKFLLKLNEYSPEISQFLMGSLLSAFTLFFFKSSSLSSSFFFMLFIVLILFLNELNFLGKFKVYFKDGVVQLCLTFYLILFVPTVIGRVHFLLFTLSLILSLLCAYIIDTKILKRIRFFDMRLTLIQLGLFSFLSSLYFFKLIPPVPLSVTYIGVFKDIKKIETPKLHYLASTTKPWWRFWEKGNQYFRWTQGEKVFVFAKIFAPRGFTETLTMEWSWLDKNKEWQVSDRVPLDLRGGRGKGFRGYSYKQNLSPNLYRVRILTHEDHELGRISINIIEEEDKRELKTFSL